MKDIAVIANFVGTIDGLGNSRMSYIPEILHNEGFQVELISSDFSHGHKRTRREGVVEFPFKLTLLHEPPYPRNICLQRFYSHKKWGDAVAAYMDQRKKPDVVYCAVPSLTAAAHMVDYCRKNKVKLIIDIQDLWPEAFQLVFNVPVVSTLVFAPLRYLANKIYAGADEIVAVSQTYADRGLQNRKKCGKSHVVFLGTELSGFDKNVAENPCLRDEREYWIGYCGTLGSSYDLKCVIDAVARVHADRPVRLVVMGDGPKRQEFEEYAVHRAILAEFTGRLPYTEMCGKLSACDLVVNPISRGAAQSIINKHADYAACGRPVVSTQESQEYRDLIESYQMGFNCENNNPDDMATRIEQLLNDKALSASMGKQARKCAEEKFDRQFAYQEIVKLVTGEET